MRALLRLLVTGACWCAVCASGEAASETDPNYSVAKVVVFVGLSLVSAGLVEALPSRVLKVLPQSVVLLLSWLVLGVIVLSARGVGSAEARFLVGLEIAPLGLQLLFLPPLIFSELFKSNVHMFIHTLSQTLILAFPGVLIGTGLVALFPLYVLPQPWGVYESLAFGGMLSATDPVAVMVVLHELGASKKLSAIISGESILNDGSAIVVCTLFLELLAGEAMSGADIVVFTLKECFGSVALGAAFGLAQLGVFYALSRHPSALVATTVGLPYLCYACALMTGMSGVLALVPLGLMSNAFGRASVVGAVADRMQEFWDVAEFVANAVLFSLSGLVVADELMGRNVGGVAFGYAVLLYLIIVAVRFLTLLLLFPAIAYEYPGSGGMDWREALIASWGGLRGGVGLTLALAIRSAPGVSREIGDQVTFYMGACVVLTLLFNSSSCAPLLRRLRLQNEPHPELVRELQRQFKEQAASSLTFAGGDAAAVREALQIEPHGEAPPPETMSSSMLIKDTYLDAAPRASPETLATRRHFMLAQAVTYAGLRDRRVIGRLAWYVLKSSIDVALDKPDAMLAQWRLITRSSTFRTLVRLVELSRLPARRELARLLRSDAVVEPAEALAQASASAAQRREPASGGAGGGEPGSEPGSAAGETRVAVGADAGGGWRERLASNALFSLAEFAYGYMRAHQVSRAALMALHSSRDKLRAQRQIVWQESLQGCAMAAHLLNQMRRLSPDVLKNVKAKQLAVSIRYEIVSKCLLLADLGLLEQREVHQLVHAAEAIWLAASEVELQLIARPVALAGDFETNEDLYPFDSVRKRRRGPSVDRRPGGEGAEGGAEGAQHDAEGAEGFGASQTAGAPPYTPTKQDRASRDEVSDTVQIRSRGPLSPDTPDVRPQEGSFSFASPANAPHLPGGLRQVAVQGLVEELVGQRPEFEGLAVPPSSLDDRLLASRLPLG